MTRFTLPAFLLVVLHSCGWHSDGPARLDELYPAVDAADPGPKDVPVPDVSLGDVAGEGLPGHWAVRMVQKGEMLGMEITLADLFLATVDSKSSKMTMTYCNQAMTLDTPGLVESQLPEILIAAMAKASPEVTLPGDGSFPASEVAWTWGLKLKNPKQDPIPTDGSDPTVWDQDGDGKPGITVHVILPEKGDRYMVRRSLWSLGAGSLSQDGQRVTGTLTFTLDEACLGAVDQEGKPSNVLATVAPITPAADGSAWQMRRVAADYGCERLVAEHEAIFGQGSL